MPSIGSFLETSHEMQRASIPITSDGDCTSARHDGIQVTDEAGVFEHLAEGARFRSLRISQTEQPKRECHRKSCSLLTSCQFSDMAEKCKPRMQASGMSSPGAVQHRQLKSWEYLGVSLFKIQGYF
jgi:hypothetical protein